MPATGVVRLVLLYALAHVNAHAASVQEREAPERAAVREHIATALVEPRTGDRFDAEVWLATHHAALRRFMPRRSARTQLLELVYAEARRQEIDPDLALAVIEVESGFDRFAISSAGARGLMQVMPFWKRTLGRPGDNLTLAATNIRYGMAILAHYLERASGDVIDALGRYHGSKTLAYPQRVLRAWNEHWRTHHPDQPAKPPSSGRHGLRACTVD